ncbi:DNA-binding response regulator [Blautia obeum]|jgi:DNA-binding LytR/AlgR family response regulator|uniref:Stage 0 sporulation protein A homolog n=1 Tax=Blautia obeum TaxID=40520 RepID=A0A412ELG1_9FIRM|nr:LytTR family DNA-binding domain-containing protein [Blautia obeum]DAL67461.1 MAG TPA: response regulator [Caudoviricetes sp.]RGR45036.1 DNA-binding response regulator [Blautia obeum]RGS15867.1 DNA-binding response regulator [Blautia obeum]RGZ07570.1 DNA-binding response regulator [Blautia obeum]DAU62011.1 MAG TPA: response regulator [Caudoviricetes sp.]
MKIAICDDNSLQIDFFKAHVDEFLKKRGDKSYTLNTYSSGKPLIDDIADGQWYDIVVLDVVLDNENGINVARQLRKNGYNGNIAFWTAYKNYVFDALDVLPVHYIIKGSEHGRMYSVVAHTLEDIREKALTIKNRDHLHRVEFRHIEYIESRNKSILVHCTCGVIHVARGKLSDIEPHLDGRFLRCHQSYIVNMDEIKDASDHFEMISGDIVPIRQREAAKIRNLYKNYIENFE